MEFISGMGENVITISDNNITNVFAAGYAYMKLSFMSAKNYIYIRGNRFT